jgi:hypothetical protein
VVDDCMSMEISLIEWFCGYRNYFVKNIIQRVW